MFVYKGGNRMNFDYFNRWRDGLVYIFGFFESNKFVFLIGGFRMS